MARKKLMFTKSKINEAIARKLRRMTNEDVLGDDWNASDEKKEGVYNNYEPFEAQEEDKPHNASIVKEPNNDKTNYQLSESRWMKQSNGKLWLTEDGKKVPSECPVCGKKMNVKLKGEPIFECQNGHYYGTVKFPDKK